MLILASGSPRRKEILARNNIEFVIRKAVSEEKSDKTEPAEYVAELAYNKAEEVFNSVDTGCFEREYLAGMCFEGDFIKKEWYILAADTVVAVDHNILGKPKNQKDAFNMIKGFAGRSHNVYTGVCIFKAEYTKCGNDDGCIRLLNKNVFCENTIVNVKPISDEEIEHYIEIGESMDKAGAYAIQGEFSKYIESIEGDYDNVVGLPYKRVMEELNKMGFSRAN